MLRIKTVAFASLTLLSGVLLAACTSDNGATPTDPTNPTDPAKADWTKDHDNGATEWETGGNPDWDKPGSGGGGGSFDGGTAMPAPPSSPSSGGEVGGGEPTGSGGIQVQPGTLTAGSFDDHLNPGAFDAYRAANPTAINGGPDLDQRAVIRVTNAAGAPVRAKVVIRDGNKVVHESTTGSDGRALYLPGVDGAGSSGAYDVEVSAEGVTASLAGAKLADQPWELTLAATTPLPKKLDLAFIVDATGSMSDELEFLKAETAHIASQVEAAYQGVDIRFALIVYRDEGDQYVSRGYGFSDLQSFKGFLAKQAAGGGGDMPEAMHVALGEATSRLQWREGNVARIAFLLADAPPHDDKIDATFKAVDGLRKAGVRLYPVAASGADDLAEHVLRHAAFMTLGRYLFLTDDSGVGNPHAEPKVPCYEVEKLEKLMIRMIASELAGELIAAKPADVLRTVGQPNAGVCSIQPPAPSACQGQCAAGEYCFATGCGIPDCVPPAPECRALPAGCGDCACLQAELYYSSCLCTKAADGTLELACPAG